MLSVLFFPFFSLCCASHLLYICTSNDFISSLMSSAFVKNLVTQYSPYILNVKNICGNIFPHKGEHYNCQQSRRGEASHLTVRRWGGGGAVRSVRIYILWSSVTDLHKFSCGSGSRIPKMYIWIRI